MTSMRVVFAAIVAFAVLSVALAQDQSSGDDQPVPVDQDLFEQGEELFGANCTQCHGESGKGSPPTFPAFVGNENLEELELIVRNVRQGQGAMPAFPELDARAIAALATYVRNAWDNDMGGARPERVEAVLAELGEGDGEEGDGEEGDGEEGEDAETDAGPTSIWDGVYTEAQAERGRETFVSHCAQCHGPTGDGAGTGADMPPSPSLVKGTFFREWGGSTVRAYFEVARSTMPLINPGGLSDQQYADSIAYLLQVSGLPAGDEELPTDPEELQDIRIEENPDQD